MAWFYDLINFVLLLFGFSQNLSGVNDGSSFALLPDPGGENSPSISPSPGSTDLLPFQTSPGSASVPVPPIPVTSDSPPPKLPVPVTGSGKTVSASQQAPHTDILANVAPAPSDNIPPFSNGSPATTPDNTPPANLTNPAEAFGSDLNKNTAQSMVMNMTNLTPIQRFVQALLELNVEKVGDNYDKEMQDLILYNFGLNNKAKYYNTVDFIQHCGRPFEEYTVKTSDGYFLKLFRIPGAGSPVLFMHGLLSCSDDWLTVGCKKSAPYMAYTAGHDVWLGNARGSKYSQRHETLDPTDIKFWDFSWHEIGVIDLPTIIDFILIYTNQPKLSYVGHSQGTTSVFVLLSEKQEYNDKVYLVVALSPVAWMGDLFNPLLQVLSQFIDDTEVLLQIIGMGQFALSDEYAAAMRTVICGTSPVAAAVCDPVLSCMYGFSPAHKNIRFLPVQSSHILTSSASKQVIHYMQEIRSGKFQQFNYGAEKNRVVYGAPEPPEYPVERITAPTALFYSTNDWMAAVSDVQRLQERLPNVVYSKQIEVAYSHIDFIWARNADQFLYFEVLDLIGEYAVDEALY